MDTECTKCIFYEQNTNELCMLDKIELYRKNDIHIANHQKTTIKNFSCLFERDSKWLSKNKNIIGRPLDKIEDIIIYENGFPYSCLIYVNEIDVERAIDVLLSLKHIPSYIHIAFPYGFNNDDLFLSLHTKLDSITPKIRYKVCINVDKDLDHFYETFLGFLLKVQTPFISIYNENCDLNVNFTAEISEKIHKELLSFPYASTKNNEFMLFHRSIIEEYLNIVGEKFLEKILESQCQHRYLLWK